MTDPHASSESEIGDDLSKAIFFIAVAIVWGSFAYALFITTIKVIGLA